MVSLNKSIKEYVILKFGEEGEEIKYLENGELSIADDAPTEIIASDNLKTLNKITLQDCVWKDCKLRIPNTVKTLHINGSMIDIPDFLNYFPALETFGVSQSYGFTLEQLQDRCILKKVIIKSMDVEKIEHLSNLTNLQAFSLSLNKITRIEGLENLKNLSILDLSHNKIGRIENIGHLVKLEELYLGENQIQKINGLENLKNLRILDLSNNQINKIEGLDGLNNLEELYLRGNNFSFSELDRGEISSYFKDLVKLKVLNFKKYPDSGSYSFETQ